MFQDRKSVSKQIFLYPAILFLIALIVVVVIAAIATFYEKDTFWCYNKYLDLNSGDIRTERYYIFLGPLINDIETHYSVHAVKYLPSHSRNREWVKVSSKVINLEGVTRKHFATSGMPYAINAISKSLHVSELPREEIEKYYKKCDEALRENDAKKLDLIFYEVSDKVYNDQVQ